MTDPYYSDDWVTLYHGDCREITEWLAADVLVTDPPYGIAYVRGGDRRVAPKQPVIGDGSVEVRDQALAMWGERPALVFGSWRAPRPASTRRVITWWKRSVGPGAGDVSLPWGSATEEVYVLGSGFVGHRRANVIETNDCRQVAAVATGHPSNKPLELMSELVDCCVGVIADPFAGSGSTLLAARRLGRKVIGVELEERYCEVAAKRLAQHELFVS